MSMLKLRSIGGSIKEPFLLVKMQEGLQRYLWTTLLARILAKKMTLNVKLKMYQPNSWLVCIRVSLAMIKNIRCSNVTKKPKLIFNP